MTDRPILFSAPMVRALLAGAKTQTRRAKGLPVIEKLAGGWHIHDRHGGTLGVAEDDIGRVAADYCRIAVGDRLYVREHWRTWAQYDDVAPRDLVAGTHVAYEATSSPNLGSNAGHFRQGMHMPRWASRITLHVTDVRVQRLQDISDEDAVAEGTPCYVCGGAMDGRSEADCHCFHRKADATDYRNLWEAINGPDSWNANPWVAAYTFTVERANIDQAKREIGNG